MKIKYEANVEDCGSCIFLKEWKCEIDKQNTVINNLLNSTNIQYPCVIRPCPVEVK